VERKEAYLDLYAYDHPCPAWKDIAEILRLFNLSKQYDLVNETYIKGMTSLEFCIEFLDLPMEYRVMQSGIFHLMSKLMPD
jgi:hypothetical protein